VEGQPAAAQVPVTADMRQEEINALFNPDDVPAPKAEDAKPPDPKPKT
jgi:hypothetical protein